MAFMFEKLEVYQKAIDFADCAGGLTDAESAKDGKGSSENSFAYPRLSVSIRGLPCRCV